MTTVATHPLTARVRANQLTARWARLRRLALQAWVMLFVGGAGTTLASVSAVMRPAVQVVWAGPVVVWGIRAMPALPPSVAWTITGVLVAYGVTSLTSRVPWMSLETAGFAAAAAAWFVAAAAMSASTRTYVARAGLLALTAWFTALATVWSIDTVAWIASAGWPPPGEPIRNYVWLVGNAIPVLALLGLPLVAWLGSEAPDRLLMRAFAIAAVAATVLSGGVIGFIGIFVAITTYAALAVMARSRRLRGTAIGIGWALVVLMGAVAGAAALGWELPLPSTATARLRLWEQGLHILASHPFTGTGPGTVALVRREFIDPHAAAVLTDHLHSVPLQAAAEGGTLLLGALAAAVVAWGWHLWTSRCASRYHGRLVVACLAGAAATFAADSFFDLPVVVALLITVAAWCVAPARDGGAVPAPRVHRSSLLSLKLAIAVLALVSVLPVASGDAARLAAAAGRSEAQGDDWSAATRHFETATQLNPNNPLYHLELGEAARQLGMTGIARDAFQRASEMSPADGRTWGALAAVTPDPEARVALLTLAAQRADGDPQFSYRLGTELASLGRLGEAADAYAEAVVLESDLIALFPSRAADSDVSRDAVLERVPGALRRLGDAARIDAGAVMSDIKLVTRTLGPEAPAAWRAVAAARDGHMAQAHAHLAEARAQAPTHARTWQAAAAVARLACDVEAEQDALRLERMLLDAHRFQRFERLRAWERVYREPGLGDFQPDSLPPDRMWPQAFIALPPCE